MPRGQIYRLATFFRLSVSSPRANTCQGVPGNCLPRHGGPHILEALERRSGLKAGQGSRDGKFSLEAVRCLGLRPAAFVQVDDPLAQPGDRLTAPEAG